MLGIQSILLPSSTDGMNTNIFLAINRRGRCAAEIAAVKAAATIRARRIAGTAASVIEGAPTSFSFQSPAKNNNPTLTLTIY